MPPKKARKMEQKRSKQTLTPRKRKTEDEPQGNAEQTGGGAGDATDGARSDAMAVPGSSAASGDAYERGKKGERSKDEEDDSDNDYLMQSFKNFHSPDSSIWSRKCEGTAGIRSLRQQGDPMTCVSAEIDLFKILKDKHILIDTFSTFPKRVYFVNDDEIIEESGGIYKHLDKEDCFSVVYNPEAQRRTRKTKDPLVEYVLKNFENLKNDLEFKMKGTWTTGDDASYLVLEGTASTVHHILAYMYRDGQFTRAFVKGMTNGSGKVALRAFLNMAMVTCFGEDAYQKQYAWCHIIGQGPEETEKMRVALTPSSFYHVGEENRELRSSTPTANEKVGMWKSGVPETVKLSAKPSTSHADDTEKAMSVDSSKSSIHLVKLPVSGVYADIVGISGCNPNWPHFVVMGEVKSSAEEPRSLSEEAQAQLVRKMLGTMCHQSAVSGILLGHRAACLAAMQMDFDEKHIFVQLRSYDFLCADKKTFNVEEIQQLFKDVVIAMNVSKRQTKEVKHKYQSFHGNV